MRLAMLSCQRSMFCCQGEAMTRLVVFWELSISPQIFLAPLVEKSKHDLVMDSDFGCVAQMGRVIHMQTIRWI